MSQQDARGTQTALVTGASSGIGLEFSRLFARDGYHVIAVGRHVESLQMLAADLAKRGARGTTTIVADLGQPHSAAEVMRQLGEGRTAIDVLVNSAGRGVYGPFLETALDDELEMLQLNMITLTELTKLVAPAMVARRKGRIVNVASIAAFVPGPLMAGYYATKAYVLSFSEALATELEGTGVTVTVLCPPATRSGFQAAARLESSKLIKSQKLFEADEVARIGYAGMMAGERVVVPGFANWLSTKVVGLVPRRMLGRYVRNVQAPAT